MSEFYKRQKNIIVNNYKYIGIEQIIYSGIFIITILLISIELLRNSTEKKIIYFALTIGIGKFLSTRYIKAFRENRPKAIDIFIMEPDINLVVVNSLIEEIEHYISRIKTFSTWIIGLTFTLISLFITINFNYFMKNLDIRMKTISDNDLSDFIYSINQGDNILGAITLSCQTLLMLCTMIFIIYFLFNIPTLSKKHILLFLYDVRYKMLSYKRT